MVKFCVLQLPTLSMSENRIDYYVKVAKDNGASAVLLGEYVLNSFFTTLKVAPKSIINEQTAHKIDLFTRLAKKYSLTLIAPLILPYEDGFVKTCAKFSPENQEFFDQKILINYEHWNEAEFFLNDKKNEKIFKERRFNLPIFDINGIKTAVCFGFEAHFDICWHYILTHDVQCVLVPSASTFESNARWREILKTRAFLNSAYIVRANRIGESKFDDKTYEFYGESFIISPSGEIVNTLKNEEGILVCEIDENEILEHKNLWKFQDIIKQKELI